MIANIDDFFTFPIRIKQTASFPVVHLWSMKSYDFYRNYCKGRSGENLVHYSLSFFYCVNVNPKMWVIISHGCRNHDLANEGRLGTNEIPVLFQRWSMVYCSHKFLKYYSIHDKALLGPMNTSDCDCRS